MAGRITYLGGIVQNDLVLDLDAAKIDSYPQVGTSWINLTYNGVNGTLVNSPSFNLANGGSIVFDGTNDYVDLGTNTIVLNNNIPKTFSFWVKISNFTLNRSLIADMGGSGNRGWWFAINTSGQLFFGGSNNGSNANLIYRTTTNANLVSNTWYNLVVTYNPLTTTANFYRNSTLLTNDGNTIYSTYNSATTPVQIGAYLGVTPTAPLVGNIGQVLVYNKVLTQTEITQNYDSLKSRYEF